MLNLKPEPSFSKLTDTQRLLVAWGVALGAGVAPFLIYWLLISASVFLLGVLAVSAVGAFLWVWYQARQRIIRGHDAGALSPIEVMESAVSEAPDEESASQ